jgi:hypothetical protein
MRKSLEEDEKAIVLLVLIACDCGIRTNDEFEKAMKWIGGEQWRNTSPIQWAHHLADNHNIYIDEIGFGEALEKMFKAYQKEKEDAGKDI